MYELIIANADLVAGLLLAGCAIAQVFTCFRAYADKAVKGVHPIMIMYFLALNVYFAWYFYMSKAWFPVLGEISIVIVDCIWLFQYYLYREPEIRYVTNVESDAYRDKQEEANKCQCGGTNCKECP